MNRRSFLLAILAVPLAPIQAAQRPRYLVTVTIEGNVDETMAAESAPIIAKLKELLATITPIPPALKSR